MRACPLHEVYVVVVGNIQLSAHKGAGRNEVATIAKTDKHRAREIFIHTPFMIHYIATNGRAVNPAS